MTNVEVVRVRACTQGIMYSNPSNPHLSPPCLDVTLSVNMTSFLLLFTTKTFKLRRHNWKCKLNKSETLLGAPESLRELWGRGPGKCLWILGVMLTCYDIIQDLGTADCDMLCTAAPFVHTALGPHNDLHSIIHLTHCAWLCGGKNCQKVTYSLHSWT